MIQRIQSLWLFLASMISGLLFLFPLISYTKTGSPLQPVLMPYTVFEKVSNYYPLLALAGLLTALPLVTIFLFQNRKRQAGLVLLSIVIALAFLAVLFMHLANLKSSGHPEANYALVGPLLPIVSIVLLFMARAGIRKDERLIKSLDRLR